jgi:hypothetical protein
MIYSPSRCIEDSIYFSFGNRIITGQDIENVVLVYKPSFIPYSLFTTSSNLSVTTLTIEHDVFASGGGRSLFLNRGGYEINVEDVIIHSSDSLNVPTEGPIFCFLSGVNRLKIVSVEYVEIADSGVIYGEKSESITIENCIFKNIKRHFGNGAVIDYIGSGKGLLVDSCVFENCEVIEKNSKGGAVFVYIPTDIEKCFIINGLTTFCNCIAPTTTGFGGGIYIRVSISSSDIFILREGLFFKGWQ